MRMLMTDTVTKLMTSGLVNDVASIGFRDNWFSGSSGCLY